MNTLASHYMSKEYLKILYLRRIKLQTENSNKTILHSYLEKCAGQHVRAQ